MLHAFPGGCICVVRRRILLLRMRSILYPETTEFSWPSSSGCCLYSRVGRFSFPFRLLQVSFFEHTKPSITSGSTCVSLERDTTESALKAQKNETLRKYLVGWKYYHVMSVRNNLNTRMEKMMPWLCHWFSLWPPISKNETGWKKNRERKMWQKIKADTFYVHFCNVWMLSVVA